MFEDNMFYEVHGFNFKKNTVFVGISFRYQEKTIVIVSIYFDKLYPNTEAAPYRCENKVYRLRKYGSSFFSLRDT